MASGSAFLFCTGIFYALFPSFHPFPHPCVMHSLTFRYSVLSIHSTIHQNVTPENLVVFTAAYNTLWKCLATFKVPNWPACSEGACICAWVGYLMAAANPTRRYSPTNAASPEHPAMHLSLQPSLLRGVKDPWATSTPRMGILAPTEMEP
ncbi:hypothetical protein D9758_016662 [Tetrapyrgos nigripes]|uniref:Uncharacterized protein n=1 Tax=Tetrapyrgos nigripes TaxID=182062 RepID=A0A8H5FM13_9AGAR|nr:hypothetical protein D9758_016662 [Tetrapyrgos nigripes]